MSEIAKQVGKTTLFIGQIFEIIHQTMQTSDGKQKVFEKAIRSPGVRLIIIDKQNQKILLTKEFRYEINDFDFRLPGGKVCDSIEEYKLALDQGLDKSIENAVLNESQQEAGIVPKKISRFYVSKSGGPTVEWDLYYYIISEFDKSSQELEFGENIMVEWLTYDQAINMCLDGKIKEDRSVGVLMKYFRTLKLI